MAFMVDLSLALQLPTNSTSLVSGVEGKPTRISNDLSVYNFIFLRVHGSSIQAILPGVCFIIYKGVQCLPACLPWLIAASWVVGNNNEQ